MRRKDREITKTEEINDIILGCKVCSVAMQDKEGLYIVPMNFGYLYECDKLTLFFHSAKEGKKLAAMAENSQVAFEMNCNNTLIEAKTPCGYGSYFSSVVGQGKATIVDDVAEKQRALVYIMRQQAGRDFEIEEKMANAVCVFKIEAESFSAKSHREKGEN